MIAWAHSPPGSGSWPPRSPCPTPVQEAIKIGLVTALSGQPARAGEAITRGLAIAIDELSAKGGALGGRKLVLVRRGDETTPAKGVTAARELIFKERVAVLFGGLDTPVLLAIVPLVNQEKAPFMGPWAAGTPIANSGANPNYVVRVPAVDEIVNRAMLQYAQKTFNAWNRGMILVKNPWGESNEKGLMAALSAKGLNPASIEKFDANDVDVVPQLTRLRAAGADRLFMVGNVGPSAQVVESLDRMGWKVPIVSHWGPAGGRFTGLAGLVRPVRGEAAYDASPLGRLPAHRIVGARVVLVPEGRRVLPERSVLDNIGLGAFKRGGAAASEVEAMPTRFPRLRERLQNRAGLLSGGEQQMLGLAPAIVDELFRVLDALRRKDATILLVDQMVSLALADRAYVMETGRIVVGGAAAEIAADNALERAHLGGGIEA